jgi:hypothetical protein
MSSAGSSGAAGTVRYGAVTRGLRTAVKKNAIVATTGNQYGVLVHQ